MSYDVEMRAYKAAFNMEPVALMDYYVRIITYNEPEGFYRQVNFFEFVPPFQVIDLGALAAQTLGAKTNVTNFDLWDNEFGQWRWVPLDNIQVFLFNPSGVSKWQLKNITVGIDRGIIYRDTLLASTEFCKWEDQACAMQAMNFSDYALLGTRIVAYGYRFHCSDVSDEIKHLLEHGRLPCTPVICAGMGGGGR